MLRNRIVPLLILLIICNKISAETFEINDSKNNENQNIDYPFLSFEYLLTSPQTPLSDKYNLADLKGRFEAVNAEMNLGGYLDKADKITLLTTLGYAYFETTLDVPDNANLPAYIVNIPNIHHFYINLIYNHKLKHNWEIIGSGYISLATDFSQNVCDRDYNANLMAFVQKRWDNISIGAGYVEYFIGDKMKGCPIGYFSYSNKRFDAEIIAPISASCNYKIGSKNRLQFNSELDFDGYFINDRIYTTSSSPQPNYSAITNLDIRLCFDREFIPHLHWNIGFGYLYREMEFFENDHKIDVLTFDQSLCASGKVYFVF